MTDKIKFLYGTTMSKGIPPDISDLSYSSHTGALWGRAIFEHLNDSFVHKVIGLSNLNETGLGYISKFDIIFCYMVSVPYNMRYGWDTLPIVIKENCNPCPKIIMQIDNDMGHVPPLHNIKRSLDSSDLIISVSRNAREGFPDYTDTPVEYLQTPRYYNDSVYPPIKPKPVEERRGIGYLRHIYYPLREEVKISKIIGGMVDAMNVIRRVDKPLIGFTSHGNDDGGTIGKTADIQGVEHVTTYPRLGAKDYLERLSECYLALEDIYYVGGSRFASDCASLKIPVIGTRYSDPCNIAFPELIADINNQNKRVELIKKLYSDQDFYMKMAEAGFKRNYDHFHSKTCAEELVKLCKKHHLI